MDQLLTKYEKIVVRKLPAVKYVYTVLACIGISSPALPEERVQKSNLQYLIASENTNISESIVRLLEAYVPLFYEAPEGQNAPRSQIIFIQKSDAIQNGHISESALEGVEGGVKDQLLEAKSGSDECYVETFTIENSWPLTIAISTTVSEFNNSLQCFNVALYYHVNGRTPEDLQQNWQKTYIELLQEGSK